MNTRGQVSARGQIGVPGGRVIPLRGDPKDIVVLGNVAVDDIRGTYTGTMQSGNTSITQISSANLAKPTVTINSAAFTGTNLNLNLTPSTGTNNNVVKVDVYVDGNYLGSANTGLNSVSLNASSIASGSHSIEVRAFTRFMSSATATTTATR